MRKEDKDYFLSFDERLFYVINQRREKTVKYRNKLRNLSRELKDNKKLLDFLQSLLLRGFNRGENKLILKLETGYNSINDSNIFTIVVQGEKTGQIGSWKENQRTLNCFGIDLNKVAPLQSLYINCIQDQVGFFLIGLYGISRS